MRDLPPAPIESAQVLRRLRKIRDRSKLTFVGSIAGFGINHERLVVAILHQFVLLGIGNTSVHTHENR